MPGRYIAKVWPHDPAIYAPAKYKHACSYECFVPEPLNALSLRLDGHVAGLVAEAEAAIRELNHSAQPALAPLARLLLRTESIASSKVEGMQMNARDLARAEARMEAGQKAGETAREVIGNINAMALAVEQAAGVQHFGVDEIRAIHQQLLQSAPNAHTAGTIRTQQSWLGGNDYNPCGADFVPPPVEELPELLDDLCTAINDDRLPPIVQAALVHAQFETIHPFDDGNGRTGRALIHVVLRRRGVATRYVPPISVVLAAAKDRYIEGLTGFRAEGVEPWIEYFSGVAAHAAHLAVGYLDAVRSLTSTWRTQLAALPDAPRADATAWSVIDILPAHPMITVPVAAAVTGRAKSSVYQAMEQLEAAGVLRRLSTSQRNQSWEAAGLLELIARMERGDRLEQE